MDFLPLKNSMQWNVIESLGLSQSVIVETGPEGSSIKHAIPQYDIKALSLLFVKYMTKLLWYSTVDIGCVRLQLCSYTIQLSKVGDDVVVVYMDAANNPLFTIDKSKRDLFLSIGSLADSGIFD